MSLINDALKRVKNAQQHAPPSASLGPQLKPVEALAPQHRGNHWVPALLVVVGLAALYFAWHLRKQAELAQTTAVKARSLALSEANAQDATPLPGAASSATSPSTPSASKQNQSLLTQASSPLPSDRRPDLAGPVTAPGRKPQTSPSPRDTATLAAGSLELGSNQPSFAASGVAFETNQASAVGSNTVAAAAPASPTPPPLKLQGIVFSPQRPSALLSGRTVFLGDRVREMRVVAISSETLTLSGGGRTNILRLADN